MIITCTRRLTFESGHRVVGHEGKCLHPHGHSYKVFITARAPQLDKVGRVIDFSVLKERVGGFIDKYWDHGFIVWQRDQQMIDFLEAQKFKKYMLPMNPTAENLAAYLLKEVCPTVLKGTRVKVTKIEVWETENCRAIAEKK